MSQHAGTATVFTCPSSFPWKYSTVDEALNVNLPANIQSAGLLANTLNNSFDYLYISSNGTIDFTVFCYFKGGGVMTSKKILRSSVGCSPVGSSVNCK